MSTHFKMNSLDWAALALIIVGALNWGLVGIGYFVDATANWNLVNLLLGSVPALEAVVYLLVGLSAIYGIYFAARLAGTETSEPTMKPEGRKSAK